MSYDMRILILTFDRYRLLISRNPADKGARVIARVSVCGYSLIHVKIRFFVPPSIGRASPAGAGAFDSRLRCRHFPLF